MVAPTWLLMSSPTMGTPAARKRSAHSGSDEMNTGMALTKPTPGLDAGGGVVALGVLRPDRQVGHEDVGARVAQGLGHVDRLGQRLLDGLAVVLAQPVEGGPPLHLHPQLAHRGELDGVVLAREDGLADVEADLGRVDVERGDHLHVVHVVAAEHHVHEAGDGLGRVGVAVVLEALHQRAGAVADSRDGQTGSSSSLLSSQIWMGLI